MLEPTYDYVSKLQASWKYVDNGPQRDFIMFGSLDPDFDRVPGSRPVTVLTAPRYGSTVRGSRTRLRVKRCLQDGTGERGPFVYART